MEGETRTKLLPGKYAGTISICHVDKHGEKVEGIFPIITFGERKAKEIIKHIDGIKQFVEEKK